MQSPHLRRPIAGLTLGIALISGSLAYGHEDYSYDSYGSSYDTSSSYDRGSSTRSRDPYDPYDPQSSARTTSQPSAGYGTPFGLNKSTAGAIAGALLGASSGAIIGSHKGKAGPGAAIGAGIGAVGGYLVGRQIEEHDQSLDAQQQVIEQQRQEIARNRALLEELKRRNLDARETERGVVVNLPDVLFEFNSARLTAGAQSKVAHIATVLNERARDRRVSVEGHADAIGSESYNLALSERRAEVVTQELTYDGVREARLTTRGYGEKYPVVPNTNPDGSDNPAGRAKNRRVEVVIEN
jgi:outer membrane protein OmpA-like peptidoglycan-associated protein